MSAPPDVEHDIADHLCRWSRTGRDGACLDCGRTERRATLKSPSGINPGLAIILGHRIASPGWPDLCEPQRRSALAVPTTTTKSP